MSLEHMHDEVQAALAVEALDALDPGERERVSEHLAGCAECRAELESFRETAALLGHLARPRPLDAARSDRMRARLVARAAADRPAPAEVPRADVIPITRARGGRSMGWMAAAASVALLLGVGAYAGTLRGRVAALESRAATLRVERERLAVAVASRDSVLAERETMLAGLAGPGVRVIDLASTEQRAPSGRMFWHAASHRWHFFAYNLPQVRPGREYQLWLITPAGPIGAGTFRPGREGTAQVEAVYDLPAESLRAVAVTEEPAGGLPAPSGAVLIAGNLPATE
ncbi:MAG TPA: anti-sigma factor [Longimicrobium sp.]|nr:anti-sigma factor [Longimicrobium sp.]